MPDHGLSIWNIYSLDELPENWAEEHPDMTIPEFYFRKERYAWPEGQLPSDTTSQQLTAEGFWQEFWEMTGLDVVNISTIWQHDLQQLNGTAG